jgi:hypothetical protein
MTSLGQDARCVSRVPHVWCRMVCLLIMYESLGANNVQNGITSALRMMRSSNKWEQTEPLVSSRDDLWRVIFTSGYCMDRR